MRKAILFASIGLALMATPAFAQSALDRGHNSMDRAGQSAAELTMLLGFCEPNLSDNHITETRASLIDSLGLEPVQFDNLFNRAVQEREKLPSRELALYTPLNCRVMFNDLVGEVNLHLANAAKAYEEADE